MKTYNDVQYNDYMPMFFSKNNISAFVINRIKGLIPKENNQLFYNILFNKVLENLNF